MSQNSVPGLLSRATELLEEQFAALPPFEPAFKADPKTMAEVLAEVARRMGDNYPYFHPFMPGR